jgi:short-subunit dehydrogenase
MNMDNAAKHILRALKSESKEYLFPTRLKIAIMLPRFLPRFATERILSRFLHP